MPIKLMSAGTGGVKLQPASTISADVTVNVPVTGVDGGTLVASDSAGNVGISTGNLNFSGLAQRITGDFTNATIANRVAFQSSTVNGATNVAVLPNGSSVGSTFQAYNSSDPTNASWGGIGTPGAGTEVRISSGIQGTGTYLPMTFYTNGTERMRIDTSGNLLVGTTTAQSGTENTNAGASVYPAGSIVLSRALTSPNLYLTKVGAVGSGGFVSFAYNGSQIGSITHTSTTVAYNTSSDYRLKENIAPMTGALSVIQALKPCTYTWKADGSDGQGFIAHELQAVVPDCVTGEKDAVDADGNPVYQGIDTSFLVATLTAAIQELKAELDAAKADIAALKGAAQ